MTDKTLEKTNKSYKEDPFYLIFENLQDSIFLLDSKGNLITLNPAFSILTGYTPEELSGVTFENVASISGQTHFNLFELCNNEKEINGFPLIIKSKDNKNLNFSLSGKIIQDKQSGKNFFIGTIENTNDGKSNSESLKNELKKLKEEKSKAEEAAIEAQRASEAKSLFLASMSHEIRTPMNGVLGYLELLEQEVYDSKEELNSFVAKTRSAAESLLDIINNILDISKIEAGKMELEDTDFSIREVLENAISIVNVLAEEKHLEIKSNVNSNVPWILNGDPLRIRQIFTNLLSNAIKYTKDGFVSIDVELKQTENNIATIFTTVKDTGMGIPQEKLDLLFKPYSQIDQSYNKVHRGTGLGLRLCKEFINLMGGQIGVESIEGQGSNFFFTIILKARAFPN